MRRSPTSSSTFFAGQVLVLRDQHLTPAQFVAFARRFGPPEPHVIDQFHHPADPNILILSNRKKDGQPVGLADAGTYFHTDYSYLQVPARATMLYSIEVPTAGGNTAVRESVRRLRWPVGIDASTRRSAGRGPPLRQPQGSQRREPHRGIAADRGAKAKMPLITHPLVRSHPVTGRKALYAVSGSSYGIVGMPEDEAVTLLDELAAHATQPKYVYSLAYRVGDVVIWDNASLLHSATLTDPDDPRTLVADHHQGSFGQARRAGRSRADLRDPARCKSAAHPG